MDFSLLWKTLLMGVIEGLTEFLPISSTGHLILAGSLLGFANEKGEVFEIFIQSGAMLAVLVAYRERFRRVLSGVWKDPSCQRFVLNLALAFLPAAIAGLAFGKAIKSQLFKPLPVALAFILGGLLILWAEKRKHSIRVSQVDEMCWLDALKVGCAQCLALIPGTSRSGATILGGLLFGLSRPAATEFSFFLAVPTLTAAGAYDLYKHRHLLSRSDLAVFGLGALAAFLSAYLCVRWLLRYVSSHDFSLFAWYRIAFGLLVLVTGFFGWVNWNAP
ncbi:MAG: undecaprenyl-diphosphate phosphatase [Bryobacteraceae bacterium]|nr:undecaprenyl-diphosphate phosphatase [Bryobacteraceae bacterium]MDW8378975.1 undecaprenyl-diphosphate phosphatase [Bryobacterales bacterium]